MKNIFWYQNKKYFFVFRQNLII